VAYGNGWNTLVLENHDNPRSVSRFGLNPKRYHYEAATMLAAVTFLGFGIPFIYMGEEAGIPNTKFRSMEDLKDPVSHFVYRLLRKYGIPHHPAFDFICYGARDHARVPIPWDDSANGGFNRGHAPWTGIHTEYRTFNVKKDLESEHSIYRFYQKLLALKKSNETAVYGRTEEYSHENRKVIAYSREYEGARLFVAGNFTAGPVTYALPGEFKDGTLLLNNYDDLKNEGGTLVLKPYQAVVFEKKIR
jgi:glycosidase